MWQYHQNPAMYHSLFGAEWKKHKYIKKEKTKSGSYRYIYSDDLSKETGSKTITKQNRAKNSIENVTKKINDSNKKTEETKEVKEETKNEKSEEIKELKERIAYLDNLLKQYNKQISDIRSKIKNAKNAKEAIALERMAGQYTVKAKKCMNLIYELVPILSNLDEDYALTTYVESLKSSGDWDNIADNYNGKYENFSDDEILEKLRKSCQKGESIQHLLERFGDVNERSKGLHPDSVSNLKRIETKETFDSELSRMNSISHAINSSNLDADNNGIPDDEEDPFMNYYGYRNNCSYCTAAYELRSRGYDVVASAVSINTNNYSSTVVDTYFEGGTIEDSYIGTNEDRQNFVDTLLDYGNGSRGYVGVVWKLGGGHAINFEVQNDTVYIIDSQADKIYTFDEYYDSYGDWMAPDVHYCRTDNLTLRDTIVYAVKNKK